MGSDVISKPVAKMLPTLTHEPRLDVIVSLAVKDRLQLRSQTNAQQLQAFEQKYGMDFAKFHTDWHSREPAKRPS